MALTTKARVENLLKYVPQTRSDDKFLCVVFMQKAGLELTERQIAKFYEMDDLWNVRRYRQRFQEQGKYPATKEVEEYRFEKFRKVKQGIASDDPEEVLNAMGRTILPFGQ